MAVSFNTNLQQVAKKYLGFLGIRMIENSFIEKLTSDPHYPSLLSLSNTFDYFKIENKGFNAEQADLEMLPTPFIAYLRNQGAGKDFAVVKKAANGKIIYYGDKWVNATNEDFLKDWTNISFIVNHEKVQEAQSFFPAAYNKHRTDKLKSITAFFVLLLLFAFSLTNAAVTSGSVMVAAAMVLFKTIGFCISLLLLYYETDKSNAFVKNICTAGQKTNCDAVLNSKAATIGGISWSEAGFYYFAAGLLLLAVPNSVITFSAKISLLQIAAIAAAAYIPFSIYYQYKVVKNWCPLCLAVQAVLFTELLLYIFFSGTLSLNNIDFNSQLVVVLFCIALPILVWYYAKPLLKQSKDADEYKAAYKRVMYNPEIFKTMLQKEPDAPLVPENMGIVMGNPAAANTLLKVCNPYCKPCSQSHRDIESLLKESSHIKVKIIYRVPDVQQDKSGPVVKHFMAIAKNYSPQQTEHILMEWYKATKKDFDAFAKKYPAAAGENELEEQIVSMRKWCEEANISHTPFLFFNGRQLPEFYTVEDLQYLLT